MKRFLIVLSGSSPAALALCGSEVQKQKINLGLSVILSTLLAFIGGADVARQFTGSLPLCLSVGALWAMAVCSFDYFLLAQGPTNKFFQFIRVPVGFANIIITMTALFIMLNQASIDSGLRLSNAASIAKVDSIYLAGNKDRYAGVTAKQAAIDAYHAKNCLPEAANGHPGPLYEKKHAVCVATNAEIKEEKTKLDENEKQFFEAYQSKRRALLSVTDMDFFAKAKQLPAIFKANLMTLVLGICLFIFLSYIELQGILLKFSTKGSDEYINAVEKIRIEQTAMAIAALNQRIDMEKKEAEDELARNEEARMFRRAKDVFVNTGNWALMEGEAKRMIGILHKKGYSDTAKRMEKELKKLLGAHGWDTEPDDAGPKMEQQTNVTKPVLLALPAPRR